MNVIRRALLPPTRRSIRLYHTTATYTPSSSPYPLSFVLPSSTNIFEIDYSEKRNIEQKCGGYVEDDDDEEGKLSKVCFLEIRKYLAIL